MKKLLTLTVLMATLAMTHAELTTKEFDQLKTWATNQGYTYDGIAKRFNCFAFSNHSTNMVTLVPTSSDTADEAINALIASIATCRLIAETAPNEQPVAVAPAVTQSVAVAPAAAVTEPANVVFGPPVENLAPNGVPVNVMKRIRTKAVKDWPNEYTMQQYQIEEEVEAYLALHENE